MKKTGIPIIVFIFSLIGALLIGAVVSSQLVSMHYLLKEKEPEYVPEYSDIDPSLEKVAEVIDEFKVEVVNGKAAAGAKTGIEIVKLTGATAEGGVRVVVPAGLGGATTAPGQESTEEGLDAECAWSLDAGVEVILEDQGDLNHVKGRFERAIVIDIARPEFATFHRIEQSRFDDDGRLAQVPTEDETAVEA